MDGKLKTYYDAISAFGNLKQIIKTIEELSELQKELAKIAFNYGNYSSVQLNNLSEEIADVEIMLKQIKIIFGNNMLINKFKKKKLERLKILLDKK